MRRIVLDTDGYGTDEIKERAGTVSLVEKILLEFIETNIERAGSGTRDFVLYGCGSFGEKVMRRLVPASRPPAAVADGDPAREGEDFFGFPILSPEEATRRFGVGSVFFVAIQTAEGSPRRQAIRAGLLKKGFRKIVFLPEHLYVLLREHRIPVKEDAKNLRSTAFEAGFVIRDGMLVSMDSAAPGVNVVNGERVVPNAPADSERQAFIIGSSVAFSLGVPDNAALAFHLQSCFNGYEAIDGKKWRVRNFGGISSFLNHYLLQTCAVPARKGDMVIAVTHFFGIPAVDFCMSFLTSLRYCRENALHFILVMIPLPEMFESYPANLKNQPFAASLPFLASPERYVERRRTLSRDTEEAIRIFRANGCPLALPMPQMESLQKSGADAFIDQYHLTAAANKAVAEVTFNECVKPFLENPPRRPAAQHKAALKDLQCFILGNYDAGLSPKIRAWLASIEKFDAPAGRRLGAIVMNCNPFTNGHLHLVRLAAERVDGLYVFVVQEERSEFSFAERFRMAREATAGFANVIVNPAGEYIISSLTFSEYFGKSTRVDDVDPSFDVAIFGSIIAPELGVTARFVGEEPLCRVTSRYNDVMVKMLPPMGISVEVIPRVCQGGEPVSASRVREEIDRSNWDAVRSLVPQSSYDIIREAREARELRGHDF